MATNEMTVQEFRKAQAKTERERLETELLFQMRAAQLPEPERQFRFGPRWIVDFGFPPEQVLIEVQGGSWIGGRHTRGKGYADDCRRLHRAQMLGWHMIFVTGDMIQSGEALQMIEEALRNGA